MAQNNTGTDHKDEDRAGSIDCVTSTYSRDSTLAKCE